MSITTLIFKKSDNSFVFAAEGKGMPSEFQTDDYVSVEETEPDFSYVYTYDPSTEKAVKGNLFEIDQSIVDEEAKKQYREDRKNLYPDLGDQLDDLYHQGAFSADMAAKIKAVKDAHPKPAS